jgi:aminocarboxymuconate-semialdehyde decarboxylase
VISPAPAQCYYNVPAEVGINAARMVNEGVAAIAASMPDRIPAAMGSVPLQAGGEAAASELEYAVKTLGLKGVEVLAHVGELELSDPSFEPFWAKAEALGAVVFIHPSGFTEPRRFGRFYFSNVIGNPLDTTMALHHLIFDGVLDRYPGLKIIASMAAGICRRTRAGSIMHGGAQRCARSAAEAANFLSEENLLRYDRFHPRPVGSLSQTFRGGQDPARDRLSLRHGGI